MKIVLFCHSLLSDWGNGHAHFLRGIASELIARGHEVVAYERVDAWSVRNLLSDRGDLGVARFLEAYPMLASVVRRWRPHRLDLDEALDGASLVLVHEWTDPALVARLGEKRRRSRRFRLLFHDSGHRAVTAPEKIGALDLRDFDGVLAFGDSLREVYVDRGLASRAFTWHEAADTRVFHPREREQIEGDVVWIGDWAPDERGEELEEFLVEPIWRLAFAARIHATEVPSQARRRLEEAFADVRGPIANHDVPDVFARFRATVHVPRRPYSRALRGIPPGRFFEAFACGIPLVSAPWDDAEHLFTPGVDYLLARDGREMERHLRMLCFEPSVGRQLAASARERVLARHTCAHRVDELMAIHESLLAPAPAPRPQAA